VNSVRSVWHVAREYTGIAEAGGVKDVASGLCRALALRGIAATAVVPFYGMLPRSYEPPPPLVSFTIRVPDHDEGWTVREEPVSMRALVRDGVRILLVDSPRFAGKRGVYTYTPQDERENPHKKSGTGHWDFLQMNAILAKAALLGARQLGEEPSLFHCHDGHAALLPAMMRADPMLRDGFAGTGALVTIHNAGEGYHQEIWDRDFARLLTGLGVKALERAVLNGMIDPFLLAAPHAVMNTVSEQYARELLLEQDRERGGGLGRALREGGYQLAGVTNGVDPAAYDPRNPESSGLPARFDPSRGDLQGREQCRRLLGERLAHLGRLPGPGVPVYAFVGRLASQKGVDVLAAGVRAWLGRGGDAAFVVLGEGEKWAEDSLHSLAADPLSRGRVFFLKAYDTALAKLIDAASDFLLIPSVYEPCGLTDFHAQLLGCIPVVHRVGGLVKVEDGITGFSWEEHSAEALAAALDRTAGIFRHDRALLDRVRKQGFERVLSRYTWERVLEAGYMPLYESALTGGEWRRG
jgi:starch synthase